MKKGINTKRESLLILVAIVLLILIVLVLVYLTSSFKLFPTPESQTDEDFVEEVETYINPETGVETRYNPNYITEEEIKGLDEHFKKIEEHGHQESPETTPELE